jgi:hypothetical protein
MTIGDRLKVMTSEQLWRWAVAALFDSTVNPIDALGVGIVTKTGVGPPSTYAARSIAGTSQIVDVANGSGVSGNPIISLAQNFLSGWTRSAAITSCASATLVNITGANTFLSKGDKLHLHDTFGNDSYHYVIATSSTQATVVGDSAPAGSLSYGEYSKAVSPFGFPGFFNWTPAFTGFSADPASPICRFYITGNKIDLDVWMPNAGTSSGAGFTMTAPVSSANISGLVWGNCWHTAINGGSNLTVPGRVYIGPNINVIFLDSNSIGGGWSGVLGKSAAFHLSYEF